MANVASDQFGPTGKPSKDWQASMVTVFGDSAVLASAVYQVVSATHAATRNVTPSVFNGASGDPFEALVSPDVPAVAGRLMVDRLYAEIELMAMAHAMRQRRPVAATKTKRLLTSLLSHLKESARLLTVDPGAKVPRSLVPPNKVLDLRELQSQEAAARLAAFHRRQADIEHLFDD
jgi:hypothetical protein